MPVKHLVMSLHYNMFINLGEVFQPKKLVKNDSASLTQPYAIFPPPLL